MNYPVPHPSCEFLRSQGNVNKYRCNIVTTIIEKRNAVRVPRWFQSNPPPVHTYPRQDKIEQEILHTDFFHRWTVVSIEWILSPWHVHPSLNTRSQTLINIRLDGTVWWRYCYMCYVNMLDNVASYMGLRTVPAYPLGNWGIWVPKVKSPHDRWAAWSRWTKGPGASQGTPLQIVDRTYIYLLSSPWWGCISFFLSLVITLSKSWCVVNTAIVTYT